MGTTAAAHPLMDVSLDDDDRAIADLARRIADAGPGGPPPADGWPLDQQRWADLEGAGLADLPRPGTERGVLAGALAVEQLATVRSPLPLVGTVLARWLQPGGATDGPAAVGLTADLSGPGIDLAWDATGAAAVVGLAGDDVVRAAIAGPLGSADLTRGMSDVGAPEVVGTLDEDERRRWHAAALALVCADLLGSMQGALDLAVAHALERHQFGQPIGSFQAIAHLCAEALVDVESSRSAVWHAAWAADHAEPAAALRAARVAKAWTSRAALDVCEAAVQVLGGLGITWESPAHVHLRRALLARAALGDEHAQLRAIAADRTVPA